MIHDVRHLSSFGRSRRRARPVALVLALALEALAPARAAAQSAELPAHAREEARQRFDRGLVLYNAGDMVGAQAEFQRAYGLTGHPVVLYNLALVHANVGDAALAVEALEKLKKTGWAGLGPERTERAESVYQEQQLRVGTIAVRTDVNGAQLMIDNVDAARTPAPPQRVTAGKHIVALSAQGYEPRRLAVTVAGQAREDVSVALVPLEEALAYLELSTSVPDVVVRLDGEPLGKTPFPTEVAFKPGPHELEWTRDGYVPVRRSVVLQPGTKGKLAVPMVPTDAGLSSGGMLHLRLTEPNAVVTLDGTPSVHHEGGIRVPRGRHSVRIERSGFFDVERSVVVGAGANTVDVRLLPTPEYLGDYVDRASRQRFWSYVALGAGGLMAAGSAGFLLWNAGEKRAAQKKFDDYADGVARNSNGRCDTKSCEQTLRILADDLDAKRGRDVFGWVGLGVGAAAIGTGVLLFVTGEDPGRYDPRPESDVFGSLRIDVSIGAVGLSGGF